MITKSTLSLLLVTAVLSGSCATTAVRTNPMVMEGSNEYFATAAVPQCGSYSCEAFILTINNKTDRNLEINWNKTLYITRGQTSGGFMFDGVVYKERNSPKPPDIVFGNGTFTKKIWPNSLVEYSIGSWWHESMPSGENGIFITVNIDGKEITQKLITNISVTQVRR